MNNGDIFILTVVGGAILLTIIFQACLLYKTYSTTGMSYRTIFKRIDKNLRSRSYKSLWYE